MQVNLRTYYAIRSVLYLSEQNNSVNSSEISDAIFVSRNYVIRILQTLRKGGIVNVSNGSSGGYVLAKKPSEITLMEIFDLMDDKIMVKRSEGENASPFANIKSGSNMNNYYDTLQSIIDSYLSITIQDIIDGNFAVTRQAS